MTKRSNIFPAVAFSGVAIFLGYFFFTSTLPAHFQMQHFFKTIKKYPEGDERAFKDIAADASIFTPYTFVQPDLRNEFLSQAFDVGHVQKGETEILLFGIGLLEDVVSRDDLYPHYHHSIGRAYTELAKTDISQKEYYLEKALQSYERAHLLTPNMPDISYLYIVSLTNVGRYDEAISLARKTLSDDPRVPSSHYYLGMALMKSGEKNYVEALHHLETSLSIPFDEKFAAVNRQMYEKILAYFYDIKDVKNFITTIKRLQVLDERQSSIYKTIEDYVVKNNRIPTINIKR